MKNKLERWLRELMQINELSLLVRNYECDEFKYICAQGSTDKRIYIGGDIRHIAEILGKEVTTENWDGEEQHTYMYFEFEGYTFETLRRKEDA